MQIELIEIRDHLNRYAPFDNLPEQTLDEIARQVQVGYFKAGSEILAVGAPIHELHYVRSGAVEIHRRGGELHNRLSEGDIFGQAGLLRGNKVRLGATAIEDSLIYFILIKFSRFIQHIINRSRFFTNCSHLQHHIWK